MSLHVCNPYVSIMFARFFVSNQGASNGSGEHKVKGQMVKLNSLTPTVAASPQVQTA